jgi:hypothetical protein
MSLCSICELGAALNSQHDVVMDDQHSFVLGEIWQVYESHYVQMFEVVMEVAKAEGNIAKFGMLLDAKALDCHNSRDDNDLSRRQQSSNQLIGCCCHVQVPKLLNKT